MQYKINILHLHRVKENIIYTLCSPILADDFVLKHVHLVKV